MVNYLFSVLLAVAALQPISIVNKTGINFCTIEIKKPVVLTWEMLFKVTFAEKYSEKYKMKVNVPEFDAALRHLNNKEVVIEGFAIPTGILSSTFVLSQNPYADCYFCGNAGVETVMTIKCLGKAPKFKTDDFVKLKGVFVLNSSDINELIYTLKNATVIK